MSTLTPDTDRGCATPDHATSAPSRAGPGRNPAKVVNGGRPTCGLEWGRYTAKNAAYFRRVSDEHREPSSIADLVEDRVLNVAGRPIHHEDAYHLFSGAAENYPCGGATRLDPESHAWLEALRADGPRQDAAIRRLHSVLLSEARHEVRRRTAGLAHPSGTDLDDLAVQAADDALVAILGKLDRFRGEALFTTWARRFAQLEVPGKIRRRLGHARETPIESEAWEQRPASGDDAQAISEAADLARALGHLIVYELTGHQREVLVALTIDGADTNDLAARLDSTPGALYKTLHDARCKLKKQLADPRQKDLHPSGSAADRAEAARISRRMLRCAAA